MDERVDIEIAGGHFELLRERAIHWKAKSTLFCADLHWGKADTFRARGIPIPEGVADADLERLGSVLRKTGARRLLVLGDLVHGAVGLTANLDKKVRRWRAQFDGEVIVVKGNHDRIWKKVPVAWGIEWRDSYLEDCFAFVHDPLQKTEARYAFAGHLHPTCRLSAGPDSVRLPCFHFGKRVAVLPAFSEFSRGVVVSRAPGDRVFVLTEKAILEASSPPFQAGSSALENPGL